MTIIIIMLHYVRLLSNIGERVPYRLLRTLSYTDQ